MDNLIIITGQLLGPARAPLRESCSGSIASSPLERARIGGRALKTGNISGNCQEKNVKKKKKHKTEFRCHCLGEFSGILRSWILLGIE